MIGLDWNIIFSLFALAVAPFQFSSLLLSPLSILARSRPRYLFFCSAPFFRSRSFYWPVLSCSRSFFRPVFARSRSPLLALCWLWLALLRPRRSLSPALLRLRSLRSLALMRLLSLRPTFSLFYIFLRVHLLFVLARSFAFRPMARSRSFLPLSLSRARSFVPLPLVLAYYIAFLFSLALALAVFACAPAGRSGFSSLASERE